MAAGGVLEVTVDENMVNIHTNPSKQENTLSTTVRTIQCSVGIDGFKCWKDSGSATKSEERLECKLFTMTANDWASDISQLQKDIWRMLILQW
jgi:hypothetical protein